MTKKAKQGGDPLGHLSPRERRKTIEAYKAINKHLIRKGFAPINFPCLQIKKGGKTDA